MEALGAKIPAAGSPPTETYLAAFQALHRLFGACGATPIAQSDDSCYNSKGRGGGCGAAVVSPATMQLSKVCGRRPSLSAGVVIISLTDLAHVGPYLPIAAYLDMASISQLDVTCRLFRDMNRVFSGPWFTLGMQKFIGLELVDEGIFTGDVTTVERSAMLGAFNQQFDWKCRIAHFHSGVRSFRAPFGGPEITEVQQADEIAYCCCQLRTDLLTDEASSAFCKVYIEFEIRRNPDNVSLAVVDFESGGCSSVTFSPDTGAVIRERKINETPRKVEGAYIQPLATITAGQGFEGSMGLYFCGGHLAFFRRHAYLESDAEAAIDGGSDGQVVIGPWETTGFVTNLSWAEGCRLTPCLAFRNEGSYDARIVCVGTEPPIIPERTAAAYEEGNWSSLDWDATEQDVPEV